MVKFLNIGVTSGKVYLAIFGIVFSSRDAFRRDDGKCGWGHRGTESQDSPNPFLSGLNQITNMTCDPVGAACRYCLVTQCLTFHSSEPGEHRLCPSCRRRLTALAGGGFGSWLLRVTGIESRY